MWDAISAQSPSDTITAAIMGYYWRESYFKPDAVAGWYLQPNQNICENFVKKINEGMEDESSRDCFENQTHFCHGGFGLGQWAAYHYLNGYYTFVKNAGGSIDDVALQIEFTLKSMEDNEYLWELLQSTEDAWLSGLYVAIYYDGANEIGQYIISQKAKEFYNEFALKE